MRPCAEERWGTGTLAAAGIVLSVGVVAAILAPLSPAAAQGLPRAHEASPEVYTVIAARDRTRVMLATWAPGQADAMHSHPAAAVYFLTDCRLRFRFPEGRVVDTAPRAGAAVVQTAVPAHAVENIGPAECSLVMVETD